MMPIRQRAWVKGILWVANPSATVWLNIILRTVWHSSRWHTDPQDCPPNTIPNGTLNTPWHLSMAWSRPSGFHMCISGKKRNSLCGQEEDYFFSWTSTNFQNTTATFCWFKLKQIQSTLIDFLWMCGQPLHTSQKGKWVWESVKQRAAENQPGG